MPPRTRPGITARQNSDGSWSFDLRWRQGGGRGGRRLSHSFSNYKLATDAQSRIQAAGWICHCPRHAPPGTEATAHYGPAQKRALTFAEYGRRHIELRTGIGDGQRHALQRDLERHMAPFFDSLAVTDDQAAAWLRGLEDGTHPWLDGQPLAPRTRRRLITQAGAILNAAVRAGLAERNPFAGVRVGREDHDREEEQVILTEEEWKLLRSELPDDVRGALADFLIGTGARWGEATALAVRHVNLTKRTVRITRSWQSDGKGGAKLGPTKSRTSRRTINLDAKTLAAIKPFLAGRKPDDLVFPASNGERLRAPNYWRDVWTPAVERAQAKGLTKSPRIHDLRHTHVSWLIARNVSLGVVQQRLGHDSINTTIENYFHMLPGTGAAAADAIGDALG